MDQGKGSNIRLARSRYRNLGTEALASATMQFIVSDDSQVRFMGNGTERYPGVKFSTRLWHGVGGGSRPWRATRCDTYM